MVSYTKSARSIIQGISQQDDRFMIEGQCRDLVNTVPSPVEGLVKRPSSEHELTYDFLDVNLDYYWFDREISGDNFEFIMSTARLYVVRNKVLEQTIDLDEDMQTYIGSDLNVIRLYFLDNKVYILNTEVPVATIEEQGINHAISCAIFAVGISQHKNYSVTVYVRSLADDSIVYSDSASILVDEADETKTQFVIDSLFSNLAGSTWFDTGKNKEVITCRLKDEHQATHYLTVLTNDDASNTYLKSYSLEVNDPSNLPRLGYDGQRAVVSVSEGNIDDWYLQFKSTDSVSTELKETITIVARDIAGGTNHTFKQTIDTDSSTIFAFDPLFWSKHSNLTRVISIDAQKYDLFWETVPNNPSLEGQVVTAGDEVSAGVGPTTYIKAVKKDVVITPVTGTWVEAAQPGTNNFNTKSLPITVDYNLDSSNWVVMQDEWLPRQVGDKDSAPFPKFVGTPIRRLYEYAGRLVAVTDDNIEVSTVNEFNNWFRSTATQLLTTDAFGLSPGDKRGNLTTPITLNGDLFIWGDQDQFRLEGNQVSITGSTLSGVSSFTSSLTDPIVTGDVIHFISESERYNVLYSFAPKGNSINVYGAEAVSDQIATKIPGTVRQLISSYNMNTLLIQTEEELDKLYLYNYYYVDGVLQQSAWSILEFDFPIEKIYVSDNSYKLIVKYEGAYRRLNLDLKDLVRPEYIHLDLLQKVTLVNGRVTPEIVNDEFILIDFEEKKGKSLFFELDNGEIYCPLLEDKATYECYLGKTFKTTFEPKLVTESTDQGNIKFTNKIKLNTLGMDTGPSGTFDVQIKGPGFDHTDQYNSSSVNKTIFDFNTQEQIFDIPVRARSDKNTHVIITSESHLPLTIRALYYRYRTSQRGTLI